MVLFAGVYFHSLKMFPVSGDGIEVNTYLSCEGFSLYHGIDEFSYLLFKSLLWYGVESIAIEQANEQINKYHWQQYRRLFQ